MNRKGKSWPLFVVAILIVLFSLTAIFGVSYTYGDTKNVYVKGASDIRFGIDIRGGVDVTFMPADDVEATDAQMTAAKTVIEDRLVGLGITDYESYVDNNKNRIIVRFPWKNDEADFNPQTAIDEIGTTAKMVFRKGSSATGEEILSGDDVASASAAYNETEGWVVQLKFNSAGASAFATATTELAASNGTISIWLDDNNISTATVNEAITGGEAIIKGNFDQDSASTLANQINSGSLPFALSAESYSTISPSLGAKSLDVMVQAGIIAFILVAILMIVRYRLPGTIAVISLMGQAAATLAVVSGYFTVFPGSTLTLPGIAGIILGIGMGVDANVITAERIKEELSKNKTLEGAVNSGFKMGLTPIIDGNVTIVIVAAILMGAFGPTDGFWAKVFNPIFYWFGPSTAGTIYSFGFTLLTSVLLNFVFGVWATRVMIRGAVHFKPLRKAWLFGGKKEGGADFKTPSINFIGNRKKFYTFSCALIAVVLVFCGIFGVKMDVEFKGGSMITLAYEGDADLNDLKSTIGTELGKSNLTLQTGSDISGNQTLTVTLPGSDTLTTEQLDNLLAALNEQYPDNNFVQNEVSNVDATIGKEFLLKSVVALVAACVLILLYVAYRFRKIGGLKAGSTAIVALLHDMFVVFGVFVLLRIPLNGNFIAALLTILGYSINDTVVIYDRIRENSALYGKKQMSLAELVNLSVNQSFARSLMTSITTCLALGVVCVVSVIYRLDSIYSFAFPLLFGMVSGVYSTICIATPLWVDWKNKKKAAKKIWRAVIPCWHREASVCCMMRTIMIPILRIPCGRDIMRTGRRAWSS